MIVIKVSSFILPMMIVIMVNVEVRMIVVACRDRNTNSKVEEGVETLTDTGVLVVQVVTL